MDQQATAAPSTATTMTAPTTTYTPPSVTSRIDPSLTSPTYQTSGMTMQQQQQAHIIQQPSAQQHAPQMMQPPYMGHQQQQQSQHHQLQQQQQQQQHQMQTTLMPAAHLSYAHTPASMMPMGMQNIPPMPAPSSVGTTGAPPSASMEASSSAARTLKKRKTVDNLRTGKETNQEAEIRKSEAAQLAQECLDQARRVSGVERQNTPTLSLQHRTQACRTDDGAA